MSAPRRWWSRPWPGLLGADAPARSSTGHDDDVAVTAVPHGRFVELGAVEGDHPPGVRRSRGPQQLWVRDVGGVRRVEASHAAHLEIEDGILPGASVAGQEPPGVI